MTRALFWLFVLVSVSSCQHEEPKSKLTKADVRNECLDFCLKRARCFRDICREDYPDQGPSELQASIVHQDCIDQLCETERYLNEKVAGSTLFDCVLGSTCREAVTGHCREDEVAICTPEPGSTPYLPGTRQKAPLPDAGTH